MSPQSSTLFYDQRELVPDPAVLETIESLAQDQGLSGPRILLYGGSVGADVACIKRYVPNARIYGLDSNPDKIERSKFEYWEYGEFLLDSDIYSFSIFDFVVTLSGLCVYPQSLSRRGIKSLYTFDEFQKSVKFLDSLLRRDGVMCLLNTNFRFKDTSTSKIYRSLSTPLVKTDGFVPKFSKGMVRLDRNGRPDVFFKKVRI